MPEKILIIGGGGSGVDSALMVQAMKEKYGDDIILYTPEEASASGLTAKDFGNIPTHKITAPSIMEQTRKKSK